MQWLFLYKSRSGAAVARQSHYLKVLGSIPNSATNGAIAQWKSICFASRGFWVRFPVSPLT